MICKICGKELYEFYLNDLFGVNKHTLCHKCFNEFKIVNIKTKIDEYECLSIYEYKDIVKDLIFQLKGLKDYELKDIFLEFLIDILEVKYFGYIVTFAPSYYEDDEKRGFNHVEAIFSALRNKKVKLFRKKENYKQSDQKFNDRKNIQNIIEIDKDKTSNLNKVLIVDDVLTSGNTLKTCARLLKQEGIENIKMLTISKVVEY